MADALEQYIPDLTEHDWVRARDIVLDVVRKVRPQLSSYTDAALVNAVAHHVDWCVYVAGFDPDPSVLFRRDVIGAAVAAMPTSRTSTKGRRRSILFRVGEILGRIPIPSHLPTLAGATPTTPYWTTEIDRYVQANLAAAASAGHRSRTGAPRGTAGPAPAAADARVGEILDARTLLEDLRTTAPTRTTSPDFPGCTTVCSCASLGL